MTDRLTWREAAQRGLGEWLARDASHLHLAATAEDPATEACLAVAPTQTKIGDDGALIGAAVGMARLGLKSVVTLRGANGALAAATELLAPSSATILMRVAYDRADQFPAMAILAACAESGIRLLIPSSPAELHEILRRGPQQTTLLIEPRWAGRFAQDSQSAGSENEPALTLVGGGPHWSATTEAIRVAEQATGVSISAVCCSEWHPAPVARAAESLARTGRCVIVAPAPGCDGLAASLAAALAERCFCQLMAPIRCVSASDVISAHKHRESLYSLSSTAIVQAIRETLDFVS